MENNNDKILDVKFKPFDTGSNIELHNKPNAELEFSSEVKCVEIIATGADGLESRKKLIINKEGKGWLIIDCSDTSSRYSPCDEEIAADYFNDCDEQGDFDEGLIKRMSLRYDISTSIIKAIVVSSRMKYNASKKGNVQK